MPSSKPGSKRLTKTTQRAAAKSTRVYDNVKREEESSQSRTSIILAMVDLLVENKGSEPSVADISAKSKVSERTVFRFFKDRAALHAATNAYLTSYIADANSRLSEIDLAAFIRHVFGSFDQNPKLVVAYLFSSFGQKARSLLRKRLNPILTEKLESDFKVKADRSNEAKIAFLVSLVNARLWYEMKEDFGLSGEETGEVVEWALRTLVKDLKRDARGNT